MVLGSAAGPRDCIHFTGIVDMRGEALYEQGLLRLFKVLIKADKCTFTVGCGSKDDARYDDAGIKI